MNDLAMIVDAAEAGGPVFEIGGGGQDDSGEQNDEDDDGQQLNSNETILVERGVPGSKGVHCFAVNWICCCIMSWPDEKWKCLGAILIGCFHQHPVTHGGDGGALDRQKAVDAFEGGVGKSHVTAEVGAVEESAGET